MRVFVVMAVALAGCGQAEEQVDPTALTAHPYPEAGFTVGLPKDPVVKRDANIVTMTAELAPDEVYQVAYTDPGIEKDGALAIMKAGHPKGYELTVPGFDVVWEAEDSRLNGKIKQRVRVMHARGRVFELSVISRHMDLLAVKRFHDSFRLLPENG